MMKTWVIVKMNSGTVKIWRDYGTAWGSPAYRVLGYFQGAHKAARDFVKNLPEPVDDFGTVKEGAQ